MASKMVHAISRSSLAAIGVLLCPVALATLPCYAGVLRPAARIAVVEFDVQGIDDPQAGELLAELTIDALHPLSRVQVHPTPVPEKQLRRETGRRNIINERTASRLRQRLEADYLLTGSVRQWGSRFLLRVEIVSLRDGEPITRGTRWVEGTDALPERLTELVLVLVSPERGGKESPERDVPKVQTGAQVAAIEEGVAETSNRITELTEDMASLRAAVEGLRAEVNTLNQKVAVLLEGAEVERRHVDEIRSRPDLLSDMVFIPAGEFIMGNEDTAEASNIAADPDRRVKTVGGRQALLRVERPQRRVYVAAFYIDKYEVTNGQYKVFLEHLRRTGDHSRCHPHEPKNRDHTPLSWADGTNLWEDYPVTGVDWYDAYAYAAWAGKRLPTEQEWEKAARGTDGRKWPWGNLFDHNKLNLTGRLKRVGSYPEGGSPFGLYNMASNVQEWASTVFAAYPGNAEPNSYYDGEHMVVRGTYYGGNDFLARCAARFCAPPSKEGQVKGSHGFAYVGFRCAKDSPR